mmetsp:Transcript_6184/g.15670  ORF Transcript_6184/g.15670 Transcript_6184/m.15670 type:complete len:211 (-) Transcript_6184:396-1028(-)
MRLRQLIRLQGDHCAAGRLPADAPPGVQRAPGRKRGRREHSGEGRVLEDGRHRVLHLRVQVHPHVGLIKIEHDVGGVERGGGLDLVRRLHEPRSCHNVRNDDVHAPIAAVAVLLALLHVDRQLVGHAGGAGVAAAALGTDGVGAADLELVAHAGGCPVHGAVRLKGLADGLQHRLGGHTVHQDRVAVVGLQQLQVQHERREGLSGAGWSG